VDFFNPKKPNRSVATPKSGYPSLARWFGGVSAPAENNVGRSEIHGLFRLQQRQPFHKSWF
jgi:hypothetical protein